MPRFYNDPPHVKPLRRAYSVARCQARFRNEQFDLTWDQWLQLWLGNGNYLNKGRGSRNYSLVRLDKYAAWQFDNVEICLRSIDLSRTASTLPRRPRKKL
jgi:hypothetical protein